MTKNLLMKVGLKVITIFLLFLAFNYFILVPLNFRFSGIWFFLVILLISSIGIGMGMFDTSDELSDLDKNITVVTVIVSVLMIVVLVIGAIVSTKMFNAKSYFNLIGEMPDAIEFTVDFDAVDTESNLPIVDSKLSAQLGDKEFGKYGSLGSEFHVGEFHDLSVNGNLVSVAPLEYNGFFKWTNNRNGAPGYVIVDKTTTEVEVVTGLNMKYMPSAYFSTDLHRHIYQNGDKAKQFKLIDFALELDDNMNPYWVVSALKPTIGLTGGHQVFGVYIVNPSSGDINYYDTEDVPSWVDTVFPKEFVIRQLNHWGALGDGYLNSIFAQKNVLQTTMGSRRVYNDGQVYHYTGLTSASSDEATVGFVFVNTKTKEIIRYNMSGATEIAAMESAEGIVQNFGYQATFPIPMNVYNEPTFFITLKDNKGLIKQYAYVNVTDFAIVGLGDTIDKAYTDYGEKLNVDDAMNYNEEDIVTVRGTVDRISMTVVDGTSQYEILVDGELYTVKFKVNPYLSVTQVNDEVVLDLIDDNVLDFRNITLEGEEE